MLRAALPLALAALCAFPALAVPTPHGIVPNLVGAATDVADLSAYPFAVRFLSPDGVLSSCTGVLVSRNWVLTSAGCAYGMLRGEKLALYHTVRNATTKAQGGTLYAAGLVAVARQGDIGMVELGTKIFDGGKSLVPVAWNGDPGVPAADTDVDVLGFGLTNPAPPIAGSPGSRAHDPQRLQLYRARTAPIANCTVKPLAGGIDAATLDASFVCAKSVDAAVCGSDPGAFVLGAIDGTPTVLGLAVFVDGCEKPSADSFFVRTSLRAGFIDNVLSASRPRPAGGG
ncbi:trypsin-like cysteine/serine peptidase domain-containing protein [Hyaloraphidium curvatum]|nr:trypsin-like cysteine/serine peptidase domain-containing protein [Hyaloraphidium curvatum]